MQIQMIGIDCSRAPVEIRERFSMTDSAAMQAAAQVCGVYGAQECVILSTCNRTELWVYGVPTAPLGELFCSLRGLPQENAAYLTERRGEQAVDHLLELSCGMRSQVFGEDQILTQVGHALELARQAHTAGPVLEMLFRTAVTAAKKVKTTVRLAEADQSAAVQTADFLENLLGGLAGRPCLVIGNGEMGRLAASQLVSRGCRVQMTVRRYRHGDVLLPAGVGAVSYEDRLEALQAAEIVVSATSSPHYTIRAQQLEDRPLAHPTVFCDLAVPRDIDPAVARLPGARVYDTDQLCGGAPRGSREAIAQARALLEQYRQEFQNWCAFRPLVPTIQQVGRAAAADLSGRMERTLRELPLEKAEREALRDRMQDCAEKTVDRLLFGLREALPAALWEQCIQGLAQAAGEER